MSRRAEGNRRSAVRRNSASGRRATRYLRPRRWTAERTANSGAVSRVLFPCMMVQERADEAQEADERAMATHLTHISAESEPGSRAAPPCTLSLPVLGRRRQCIASAAGRVAAPYTHAEVLAEPSDRSAEVSTLG
jgi:hypothetical protein